VRGVVPKVGLSFVVGDGVCMLQAANGQIELLTVEATQGQVDVQLRGVYATLKDSPEKSGMFALRGKINYKN
jgi:hypothetical protein